jgi:hypothetical protein
MLLPTLSHEETIKNYAAKKGRDKNVDRGVTSGTCLPSKKTDLKIKP